MSVEEIIKEIKWHNVFLSDGLRTLSQEVIHFCAERLEQGVGEGPFVMKPPTDKEHENYFLGKLNAYFELWASTWSMKVHKKAVF